MTLKLLTLAPLVFLLLAITTIRMQNPPEDEAVITVPLVYAATPSVFEQR